MVMRRRRSQAVYAKRREMVSKFWAKIPPKYQGRLIGLFLFLLVIWSMRSVWDVSRH
jgi:type II secretory pathway component PulM